MKLPRTYARSGIGIDCTFGVDLEKSALCTCTRCLDKFRRTELRGFSEDKRLPAKVDVVAAIFKAFTESDIV